MNNSTKRTLVALAACLVVAIGFCINFGLGTFSSIGWKDVSLLCPLGALGAMIASKTIIPRAVVSLVIAVVMIVIFGRLFCGWLCPVPVVKKVPDLFKSKKKAGEDPHRCKAHGASVSRCSTCKRAGGCSDAVLGKSKVDSRYIVLAGALVSTALLGFPVFCLVCPIGLTFAAIFLVISLFTTGDITWSLVFVPVLLAAEVIFLRKWCSKICPLGAFMSIIARFGNKTLKPVVDHSKCIESGGITCGKCASVCEVGINPRRLEDGALLSECTNCRACVDACPAKAISIPFIPKKELEAAKNSTEDLAVR